MDIKLLTIFPEMFKGFFETSLLKKAQDKNILKLEAIDFRKYSKDKHQKVDDYPFGGGVGMVLAPEPIVLAVEDNLDAETAPAEQAIILMTPQGRPFTQEKAVELATKKKLLFICGHYEGYDERVRDYVTEEISIGDYVLMGGEIPAMVIIDCVSRLIPGVIKEEQSFIEDSFFSGLLDYPHYTRPRVFRGKKVPEILLSGNHREIGLWRKREALRRTLERRPDLLERYSLSEDEKKIIEEIHNEK